ALVQKEGFASLNIRGLASRTNCAVGSIYNIFENIDDIALQVNAQTLKSLLLQMKGISQKKEAPLQTPLEFGNCYISYGLDNYHLWNMLFEHRLPQV
ncbi:MAG: TetR/AcrR family transcriptional regulator, partial [Nitrospinota bacterium]